MSHHKKSIRCPFCPNIALVCRCAWLVFCMVWGECYERRYLCIQFNLIFVAAFFLVKVCCWCADESITALWMGWRYNRKVQQHQCQFFVHQKEETTGQLLLWRRMCVCAYRGQVVTAFSRQVHTHGEHITGACCGPWGAAPCGCRWGDLSERWEPGTAAGLGLLTEERLVATNTMRDH